MPRWVHEQVSFTCESTKHAMDALFEHSLLQKFSLMVLAMREVLTLLPAQEALGLLSTPLHPCFKGRQLHQCSQHHKVDKETCLVWGKRGTGKSWVGEGFVGPCWLGEFVLAAWNTGRHCKTWTVWGPLSRLLSCCPWPYLSPRLCRFWMWLALSLP